MTKLFNILALLIGFVFALKFSSLAQARDTDDVIAGLKLSTYANYELVARLNDSSQGKLQQESQQKFDESIVELTKSLSPTLTEGEIKSLFSTTDKLGHEASWAKLAVLLGPDYFIMTSTGVTDGRMSGGTPTVNVVVSKERDHITKTFNRFGSQKILSVVHLKEVYIRGFRAFHSPEGVPVEAFPPESIVVYDDVQKVFADSLLPTLKASQSSDVAALEYAFRKDYATKSQFPADKIGTILAIRDLRRLDSQKLESALEEMVLSMAASRLFDASDVELQYLLTSSKLQSETRDLPFQFR